MMNPRIQKVTAEIERVKEKLAAQQQRLRELEQQKTELENSEIVGVVRGLDVTPEELASLLRTLRGGKGTANLENQEESEHET